MCQGTNNLKQTYAGVYDHVPSTRQMALPCPTVLPPGPNKASAPCPREVALYCSKPWLYCRWFRPGTEAGREVTWFIEVSWCLSMDCCRCFCLPAWLVWWFSMVSYLLPYMPSTKATPHQYNLIIYSRRKQCKELNTAIMLNNNHSHSMSRSSCHKFTENRFTTWRVRPLAAPSSTSESAKRPNTKAATNSFRRYGARKGVNQTSSRMAWHVKACSGLMDDNVFGSGSRGKKKLNWKHELASGELCKGSRKHDIHDRLACQESAFSCSWVSEMRDMKNHKIWQ